MIVSQVAVMTFSQKDSSMSLSWPSVTYITEALPSLHAYTECDVTTAVMNKGNVRPFELLRKPKLFQDTISKLGNEMDTEH